MNGRDWSAGRNRFGGSLDRRLIVSGGLGGMGGAQPLAATMNGACFLGIEVDPTRIEKRIASGYCDLAAAKTGTILCFYERGALEKNHFRTRWLTVARFNLEWLTDGKDEIKTGK